MGDNVFTSPEQICGGASVSVDPIQFASFSLDSFQLHAFLPQCVNVLRNRRATAIGEENHGKRKRAASVRERRAHRTRLMCLLWCAVPTSR